MGFERSAWWAPTSSVPLHSGEMPEVRVRSYLSQVSGETLTSYSTQSPSCAPEAKPTPCAHEQH